MATKELQIRQLDRKLSKFRRLAKVGIPRRGWIRAIRTALGMSGRQLASRAGGMRRTTLAQIERVETSGNTTIGSLRRIAAALDCTLVYALVPKDSFAQMIRRQARRTAKRIVARTSHSMALEGQSVSKKSREELICATEAELLKTLPRNFWDEI